MKFDIKIRIDTNKISTIKEAQNKALEATAEAVLSDIKARAVVPKDTGELERSGFVDDVKEMTYRIVFDTPYARRWYFNVENVTFRKTMNPNAQDHWMDYYLDGEGLEWVMDTYARFFKEFSGGIIR